GGQYKFVNGVPTSGTEVEETHDFFNDGCGVLNGTFPDNRVFERTDGNDVELNYIFNSCTTFSVGINESISNNGISIYPNPMKNSTVVYFNAKSVYQVEVIDVTGKLVFAKENIAAKGLEISSNLLTGGLYLV